MSSDPTPSPCTRVCTLDARQVCVGCGRRIEEIVEWPQASEERRRQIAIAAERRRQGAAEKPADIIAPA